MRFAWKALVAACLFAVSFASVRAAESGFSVEEVSALPRYCRDAQGFGAEYGGTPESTSYWYQQLGPAMAHIHHYCRGLLLINRARASVSKARARQYQASIGEIDYTLRHVDADFPLLPEMLTRKGEALANTSKFREAEEVLRRALELKPDYWPAYARLAEAYLYRKNVDAAQAVLKQGLARVDEPRMLQRMLDDIGKSHN